ncbi:hypothetical protein AK812_SmicGene29518 [Symbiodinium microadriaticum]|uniref:Uncharacterized protein n=1 Tax=Symbiodinium microadriaticum TaxID=2951 RepID=A0A1Q9D1K4_SYMMI|nr:hypothetical protein AK812_SmicGene29518 [Symbiodinium microadriaticum]
MVPWRPEPEPLPTPAAERERRSSRRSGHSSDSLPSELAAELLRGVPVDACLSRFGEHFRRDSQEDGYPLSQSTHCIDFFLSHDWHTSGWKKTVALLLYFNGVPAAVVTLCVCILTTGLEWANQLPGGWATATTATYTTYLLVFCFWQRIRRFCRSSVPVVFLDRLCIDQQDDDRKRRGIQGLAGFLATSKKLLVLWTPKTFTRLWCAFELAHFLRPESGGKPVEILPVPLALLLMLTCVLNLVFWSFFHIWLHIESTANGELVSGEGDFWVVFSALIVFSPVFAVCYTLQASIGIDHVRELRNLEGYTRNFSVRDAECFCCKVGHVHPDTGEEVLCDRALVYQTLRRWYTQSEADRARSMEGHLDSFDVAVRELMRLLFTEGLGSGTPPLRLILALAALSPLALLPQYVHIARTEADRARGWWTEPWEERFAEEHFEEYFWKWIAAFVHVPAVSLFQFWLAINTSKIGAIVSLSFAKWKAVVAVVFTNIFLLGGFWAPYSYCSFPKEALKFLGVGVYFSVVLLGTYSWQYWHTLQRIFCWGNTGDSGLLVYLQRSGTPGDLEDDVTPIVSVVYDRRRSSSLMHRSTSPSLEGPYAPQPGDVFQVVLRCPNYPGWRSHCSQVCLVADCEKQTQEELPGELSKDWQELSENAFYRLWAALGDSESFLTLDSSHLSLAGQEKQKVFKAAKEITSEDQRGPELLMERVHRIARPSALPRKVLEGAQRLLQKLVLSAVLSSPEKVDES